MPVRICPELLSSLFREYQPCVTAELADLSEDDQRCPPPQRVDLLARPPHISVILLNSQFWIMSPMLTFLECMFKVSLWVFLSMALDKHTHFFFFFFLRSANKKGQTTTPQASVQACTNLGFTGIRSFPPDSKRVQRHPLRGFIIELAKGKSS